MRLKMVIMETTAMSRAIEVEKKREIAFEIIEIRLISSGIETEEEFFSWEDGILCLRRSFCTAFFFAINFPYFMKYAALCQKKRAYGICIKEPIAGTFFCEQFFTN